LELDIFYGGDIFLHDFFFLGHFYFFGVLVLMNSFREIFDFLDFGLGGIVALIGLLFELGH